MGRTTIRRGAGKRRVDGKSLRLADEVRYIQRRAADHDGRVVTVGQLVLFSTETGDAWLLDPADQLAARLARDGDPEPIHIEENDTTFAIGWKGRYRIEGHSLVNTCMAATMRFGMCRTTIRRGAGKRRVDGKSLRLDLMERTELFDLMGELKLYGMKAAFDEIIATGAARAR